MAATSCLQIDYLQQKNQELQRQVDEALAKAREAANTTLGLDARNQELTKELQDVDFMAQRAQTDKEVAVRTADREIVEAKVCVGGPLLISHESKFLYGFSTLGPHKTTADKERASQYMLTPGIVQNAVLVDELGNELWKGSVE